VLVVLAMACFPGLAAAEENSGIQYETDVPTVPEDEGSNIPSKKHSGDSNTSDESDNEAAGSNTPGGVGSGGGDDSGTSSGNAGTNTGQSSPGTGGSEDKAANGSQPAGGKVGDAQSLPTVSSAVSDTDDEGGSSPLVPILIAVAVLAAISVGAFYYRQRRQGHGSAVSPNAN
jgi:cobalamin biosynthesis Mg chelatase CobN